MHCRCGRRPGCSSAVTVRELDPMRLALEAVQSPIARRRVWFAALAPRSS